MRSMSLFREAIFRVYPLQPSLAAELKQVGLHEPASESI